MVKRGETAESLRRLEAQVLALQNESIRDRNIIREQAALLRNLAAYSTLFPRANLRPIAAPVLGFDSSTVRRSILVAAGRANGVHAGAAVLCGQALVGRVTTATRKLARVRLITDAGSRIPVLIMETRDQGVLAGNGEECRLLYVERFSKAKRGEHLLTSGVGGVLPRGIPAGEIVSSKRAPGALFLDISVKPSANMHRLETVLIMPKIYFGDRPAVPKKEVE